MCVSFFFFFFNLYVFIYFLNKHEYSNFLNILNMCNSRTTNWNFFFGGHTYVELKCCKSFHHCIPKAEVWSPEFWQVFLIKHWMTFMNSDFLPLDLRPVWMEGEEGRVDESREKLIESRLILSHIYSILLSLPLSLPISQYKQTIRVQFMSPSFFLFSNLWFVCLSRNNVLDYAHH